jgi:RND family efflux transporter MFP subunit
VDEVLFEPGAIVESGQTLLTLDTSVEQAQLNAALARVTFTESTLRRTEQMAQTKAVTELELEETQSQWQQAEAQAAELRAIIARKSFVAPFRARVGLSDTHAGQYLPAGTLITNLQSVEDHVVVDFMAPQTVIPYLELGQTIELVMPQQTYTATIAAIDSQADRSTRNIRVRARWDNPPLSAVPGNSIQVVIHYGLTSELLAVPSESVRHSPQGTYVFTVADDQQGNSRASMIPVIIATTVGNRVGLTAGVKAGDRVVVQGSFKLQDGALVSPARLDN